MIRLTPTDDGVLLAVRARPGARRNAIVGHHDGALRVAVTAAADKGQANKAIAAVLGNALSLPKSAIELVSGPTSRQKTFLLHRVSLEAIQQACAALLEPPH